VSYKDDQHDRRVRRPLVAAPDALDIRVEAGLSAGGAWCASFQRAAVRIVY
jgi:hypothetical protein